MKRPSTVKELLALTGDQLRDALGLVNVYCADCEHCVDCVYCVDCVECVDCERCELCEHCEHCAYCVECEHCVRCLRCERCWDCVDCMGCWGGDVHDKRFMVWNIQLTAAQYREVRAKLGVKS